MTLAVLLSVFVLVGVAIALISPTIARILGWSILAATLVASIVIFKSFTAGGTGEFPGQIGLIFAVVVIAVVVLIGGALAFGLIAGTSALKDVASIGIDALEGDGSASDVASAAAEALPPPQSRRSARGRPTLRRSRGVESLAREFMDGRQIDPRDLLELAKAAMHDRKISTLADRVRGETLLHWCVRLDQPELAASLLLCGADPQARNGRGLPSLGDANAEFMARLDTAKARYQNVK